MSIECGKCGSSKCTKNGSIRGKQRYCCKECRYNFVEGDERCKYSNKERSLVIRMYLNNCGFRRISEILNIPLSTVFVWIKKAGQIVDEMVKARQDQVGDIEVLEMDELFTYVKKNLEKTRNPGGLATHTPEYGLLWIGTDLKLLSLK